MAGVVVDPKTGDPIGDVEVGFECPEAHRSDCVMPGTRTDPGGRFELLSPGDGRHRLFVSGQHLPGHRDRLYWYTLGAREVEVSGERTALGTIHARKPEPLAGPVQRLQTHRVVLLRVEGNQLYVDRYSHTAASLRPGDLVLGIDGYRAADVGPEALRSMFLSDFPYVDQRHRFDIRRGRRRFRVDVPL